MVNTQDLATGREFSLPCGDDLGVVVSVVPRFDTARGVAIAPVGAHDQHGTNSLSGAFGEQPAGAAGLVVGMCVDSHQGKRAVRHDVSLRRTADIDAPLLRKRPVPRATQRGRDLCVNITFGGIELQLGEKEAVGKVGATEVRVPDVGTGHVGQRQVGRGEVGADQQRTAQVGSC